VFFFTTVLFALTRKNHVRAIFKGPLSSFHVEFEADDQSKSKAKFEVSSGAD
jgi:hypothetical protein